MEYTTQGPNLKPLLLIGGKSTRMETSKHLLPLPTGHLLFEHSLQSLHAAVRFAPTIYISVNSPSQIAAIQDRLKDPASPLHPQNLTAKSDHGHDRPTIFPKLKFLIDEQQDIGPAAGLLAAFKEDREGKWMVLGCDYPLLPPSALQQLILEFEEPVTCFVNEEGFVEPLIGVWGAEALGKLEGNVKGGRSGLNSVVKEMGGKMVKPLREGWITGTNTKEEWEKAMEVMREMSSDE